MLDADEREEEVLKEVPRGKGASHKTLSDVVASFISTTESLESMSFNTVLKWFPFTKEPLTLWMTNTSLKSREENKP